MKCSTQDECYLSVEGNAFFKRNFQGKELPELRDNKVAIYKQLKSSGVLFKRVLEYGCNYGDLLNYLVDKDVVGCAFGVEASSEAIAYGKETYGDSINLVHGSIADNEINNNTEFQSFFDLVIVDDVFGWVSRQTLLQSIANIDDVIAENGYLFIRDFYPDRRTKNKNHHVGDGSVFNYKVPGSHAAIFIATGSYDTVLQNVYYDKTAMSSNSNLTTRLITAGSILFCKKNKLVFLERALRNDCRHDLWRVKKNASSRKTFFWAQRATLGLIGISRS